MNYPYSQGQMLQGITSALAIRTVTSNTILDDMKVRASVLRDEIAACSAKVEELAMLEKMIAVASPTTDEAAGPSAK